MIDTTDLYHPYQDFGDNLDLIAAYALDEVDLRAVILDASEDHLREGRAPGGIAVAQLNRIFSRRVPAAATPTAPMARPDDVMANAPDWQQHGFELLLETLRQSHEPVDITVFGSARAVAVAYNREPDLLRRTVRRIHLCAGATGPDFIEWNVALDSQAMVRLLRSDLPVALYPPATAAGPFSYGPNNCFWQLPDLGFVADMNPRLAAYAAYAYSKSAGNDYLAALDQRPDPAALAALRAHRHNVWETAIWLEISGRKLVRRRDGRYAILVPDAVEDGDQILTNEQRPCRIAANDDGTFRFTLTDQPTNFSIYYRGDPRLNETALQTALPELYRAFTPERRTYRNRP